MLYKQLQENEGLRRVARDGRGEVEIVIAGGVEAREQKAAITAATVSTSGNDAATTGVLQMDRHLPFVPKARKRLFMRDLLTTVPTAASLVDSVIEETEISDSSPQTEGGSKLENAVTVTTASVSVRTVSTWLPASAQIVGDLDGLLAFLVGRMRYAVLKKEEYLILAGNNTGEQLNGIINQATAFDTTLLSSSDGYEYLDYIGRACQQLDEVGVEPTWYAVTPAVYGGFRVQKDPEGEYIHQPIVAPAFRPFGLLPVRSNALSAAQFIVGSADPADILIRDRMSLRIEISANHSDYRTKNLVVIRAEERVALQVLNPSSFVKGTLTQSPA
jgi:HK97 family phage major capsid protein